MKAVEIQAIPGLDFDDLGLILGVVIPHKFKIPVFAKSMGFPSQSFTYSIMCAKFNPILQIGIYG